MFTTRSKFCIGCSYNQSTCNIYIPKKKAIPRVSTIFLFLFLYLLYRDGGGSHAFDGPMPHHSLPPHCELPPLERHVGMGRPLLSHLHFHSVLGMHAAIPFPSSPTTHYPSVFLRAIPYEPPRDQHLTNLWSSSLNGLVTAFHRQFTPQSVFQCPVKLPSVSSFPKYSSKAYNAIVAATLTHLHTFPAAFPPCNVHHAAACPFSDSVEKCCIRRLVYTATKIDGLNQLSTPRNQPAPSSSSRVGSRERPRAPESRTEGMMRVAA